MLPSKKAISIGYDFPSNHPRARFLEKAVALSQKSVDIVMNPHDRIFPGADTIDAVRSGKLDFGWINFAHLEQIAPDLAAMHAPFTLSDTTMHTTEQRQQYLAEVNSKLGGTDLCIAAVMRGADQIICTGRPIELAGARFSKLPLRVPGSGVYENIIGALGAKPILATISTALALIESGKVKGAITSPGAWLTLFKVHYPHVYHMKGLMMINYVLLSRRADADAEWARLIKSANTQCVTENWDAMRLQDEEILAAIKSSNECTYQVIEPTDHEVRSLGSEPVNIGQLP